MIRLVRELPEITAPRVEYIGIKCLFDMYKEDKDVLFWEQDGGKAILSLADGDMTVFNQGGDPDELSEFCRMMAPRTLFSDTATLCTLGFAAKPVSVVCRMADIKGETTGDELNSGELYDLLKKGGFPLPAYPAFAVDLCRRLNHGGANTFALRELCAAIAFSSGGYARLNGIVSLQKGFGTVALRAILQKNRGRQIVACCGEERLEFYRKNGFTKQYEVGCWKYEHT